MAAHTDREFMARALRLAARSLGSTHPNPRVGCVIVAGDRIVGEGWHVRAGEPHAEALALAAAGDQARGATAYVTLEPCCHQGRTPPCTEALHKAGIRRLVYAAADPNPRVNGGGERALRQAGIEVSAGLLAPEAERLNPGFHLRMGRGRPWVRSKIAASLDGRTALADGRSRWITGEAARRDVQRWRARSSAILTGVGTVLTDDPELTVRDPEVAEGRQPLRVVLDSAWRTPPTARLLAVTGQVLAMGAGDSPARSALERRGARVMPIPLDAGGVDLARVMQELATLETNEVLVETGPRLNGALLAAGLIDELIVYSAPHVLGDAAQAMFQLPTLARMEDRPAFRLQEMRRVGEDLRLIYYPTGQAGGGS